MIEYIMFGGPILVAGILIHRKIKAELSNSKTERTFPTSANPKLNKIYKSFECVKKGKYKEKRGYSSKYTIYVEKHKMFFRLYDHHTFSNVYIEIDNITIIEITLNSENEISQIEYAEKMISLEESSAFVQAFYDFLWMLENKDTEKIHSKKVITETLMNASKQVLLRQTVVENIPQPNDDLFSLFSDHEIADCLNEMKNKFSYIDFYFDKLEIEQQHTYERISTVIIPDLLRSYLEFSEPEQKEHKSDLLNTLMGLSKEVESIESVIKHAKLLDFQRKMALAKQ